jgi:hypothetical protein
MMNYEGVSEFHNSYFIIDHGNSKTMKKSRGRTRDDPSFRLNFNNLKSDALSGPIDKSGRYSVPPMACLAIDLWGIYSTTNGRSV